MSLVAELRLSQPQADSIRDATARINLWEGAVRSGKTIASLISWLQFVPHAPIDGELLMIGRTRETAGRNLIAVLTGPLFGRFAGYVSYTRGAPTATILGRLVHVMGANDVSAETRIRGLTVAGAYVDEATVVPEVFWQQLVARMSVRGARLFATTNPDSPNHWLKKDWIDRKDPALRAWHFVLDDNHALEPAFVAYLKRQYTGLWYQRFILGRWVLAEGAVYDMFDRRRHVIHPRRIPAIQTWLATGVDYGTTNPFHAVIIGIGVDGRLYVVSEWRHDARKALRQMTDAEYSRAYRTWLSTRVPIPQTDGHGVTPRYHVIDPSATSFRVQLHRDGIASWPADNSVLDGIRNVSSLLSTDQLAFSAACKATIDEMQGYAWDDKAQAKGEDKPLKVNDHGPDAVRYGLHTTRNDWRGRLLAAAGRGA